MISHHPFPLPDGIYIRHFPQTKQIILPPKPYLSRASQISAVDLRAKPCVPLRQHRARISQPSLPAVRTPIAVFSYPPVGLHQYADAQCVMHRTGIKSKLTLVGPAYSASRLPTNRASLLVEHRSASISSFPNKARIVTSSGCKIDFTPARHHNFRRLRVHIEIKFSRGRNVARYVQPPRP